MNLVRYDAARHALQAASSVDEVKDIRDKAQAMAAYARQAKDTQLVEWATEIKVRAERKAGEMLAAMKQTGERASRGRQPQDSKPSTLEDLGVTEKQSHRWQKLAAVPENQFEEAIAAAKEVAGEVTTAAMLRLAPTKKRKKHKKWEPNPLAKAIQDAANLSRIESAAMWLRDMKKQYEAGNGLDRTFKDELVQLRDWLDEVIDGVEPYIVSCETNFKRKSK